MFVIVHASTGESHHHPEDMAISQRVPFCWLHEGGEGLLDKLIAVLPCNAFCQSWKTPSCTQLSSSLHPTTFALILYDENSRIVCICPGLIDSAKQCEHFLAISALFIHHIRDMRKASKLSKQGFAISLHDFNFSLSFLLFHKSGAENSSMAHQATDEIMTIMFVV